MQFVFFLPWFLLLPEHEQSILSMYSIIDVTRINPMTRLECSGKVSVVFLGGCSNWGGAPLG